MNGNIIGKLPIKSIDELVQLPVGDTLQKAMELYETVQNTLYNFCTADDPKLLNIRIGTMLTLAVLKKAAAGKHPSEFSREDWAEIAESVADHAINVDEQQYTIIVFGLYATYIRQSAALMQDKISDQTYDAICMQAELLEEATQDLHDGVITEVQYIETCLWICLEAMMKLLAAFVEVKAGEEFGQLAQAVSMFAFEYGRLLLYKKEQALLTEYLQHQQELDARLEADYQAYLDELTEKSQQFKSLISHAFDSNFTDTLKATASLARAAGVEESEILTSIDDIDAFFLD